MTRQRIWMAASVVMALTIYAVGTARIGNSATPAPGFTAYATGTNVHATGLQAPGGPRLANSDIAFSAVSTGDSLTRQNEMQVQLIPEGAFPAAAEIAARGSGVEATLAADLPVPAPDVALPETAVATAPPDSGLVEHDVLDTGSPPIGGTGPLAYAAVAHTEAEANTPCGPTSPLARGLGNAADAQLLDAGAGNPDGSLSNPVLATDTSNPDRAVSQSSTTLTAFPNGDPGRFGLEAEIRETFAPISINRGTPIPTPNLVIELLGEWVFTLRAPGNAPSTLSYTVEDSTGAQPSPTTTVIRVSLDGGVTFLPANQLTFQDVFGPTGLVIPADPLLQIAVGEDPRAISAPGAVPDATSSPTLTNTVASGAVDVLRLHLLQNTPIGTPSTAGDLRIGHFEGALSVPAGGFDCGTTTTSSSSTSSSTSSTSSTSTSTSTTNTTTPSTTTTTAPPPGILEICNEADNSHGNVTGNFTYHFKGRTVVVPAGGCTGPLTVNAREVTVTQSPRTGIRMTDCDTIPAFRLQSCQPENLKAITKIAPGGVEKETILTFTNVVDDNNRASIKVCKIAGNGVSVGTPFNFTVGNRAVTITAGPANQGGYCKLLKDFPVGSNVTVTEAAKAGTHVSSIVVQPSDRKVSSNLANRTATVKTSRNTTIVNFTNAANN